jgi:phage terminase small subunit
MGPLFLVFPWVGPFPQHGLELLEHPPQGSRYDDRQEHAINDLRKRVESQFDLDTAEPAWVEVFETACATLDTVRELEDLVRSDGLITTGSKGQVTIHPALVELRHQRQTYARLVQQLGLPDRPRNHHKQRWTP